MLLGHLGSGLISLTILKTVYCCAYMCLANCMITIGNDVGQYRHLYQSMNRQEQKQWVLEYLYLHKGYVTLMILYINQFNNLHWGTLKTHNSNMGLRTWRSSNFKPIHRLKL